MCSITIYEAMSGGVPMVISALDESRAVAGDLALFAENAEDHLRRLEQALESDGPEARRCRAAAVRDCDWAVRFQEFAALLGA